MSVRTNHATNPSWESASGGLAVDWSTTGTPTFTRVADPYQRTYGRQATYTGISGDAADYVNQGCNSTAAGTAATNDWWTVSAYVKKGSGQTGVTMHMIIMEFDAADGYLRGNTGSDFSGTLTTSYQRFSYSVQVSHASVSRLRGLVQASAVHNLDVVDFTIDCLLLEKASSVADYFDGETTDAGGHVYAWTGAADASTSTDTYTESGFVGMLVTRKVG